MGRLMMSLQLNEQNPSPAPERLGEESVPPPPFAKWSASNAFDPDSDEFWDEEGVVYEAFVDEGASQRREMLEEEANTLIASGNESRRRRRDQWTDSYEMDRVVTPLPDLWELAHMTRDSESNSPDGAQTETDSATQTAAPHADVLEDEEYEEAFSQLRYRPENVAEGERVNRQPGGALAPTPSPGFPMATISVEMISDVAHRTTSPLPYVTYGNVHVFTPSVHYPTRRTPRVRRESQPAPTSISLMS
jgi:hypothetical protein